MRSWITPAAQQPILLPYSEFKAKMDAVKKEVTVEDEARPLEYEKALDEFGGDEDFLLEVMGEFLKKAVEQIDIMRKAFERQ